MIYELYNTVQHYDWGSPSMIPDLMGIENPGGDPYAELWMGAHPKAPSKVRRPDGRLVSLTDLIRAWPSRMLGEGVVGRFGRQLPFLLKVLAAGAPLSIQAHPDLDQARAGFARENELDIPFTAAHRNYRDPNHKPELICALTSFTALRGFQPKAEIKDWFMGVAGSSAAALREALSRSSEQEGIRSFFTLLMNLSGDSKKRFLDAMLTAARVRALATDMWVLALAEAYPDDVAAAAPWYLNEVYLKPGEAMYLPAGELHAYLHGMGIELMANSDNVLRGGLTPKHVDIAELLDVLTFSSGPPMLINPRRLTSGEEVYPTPAREFQLSKISRCPFPVQAVSHLEIVLCTEGEVRLTAADGSGLKLTKGRSALITPAARSYSIQGTSFTLYRATTPK